MPSPRICLAFALLTPAMGCAADDMGATTADDGPSARGCEVETRADTYTLGMTKTGEQVQVGFVDAMPAPPDRGDNTWRVAVTDMQGNALADLPFEVEPYMLDHMHGTSIEAHVTATDVPGEYVIDPVNLFMPGLWQVHLYFALPDGSDDTVEFDFCVDP